MDLIISDDVEVLDLRVSVCRDSVKGRCVRKQCKYYHLPPSVVHTPASLPSPKHHTSSSSAIRESPSTSSHQQHLPSMHHPPQVSAFLPPSSTSLHPSTSIFHQQHPFTLQFPCSCIQCSDFDKYQSVPE